MGSAFVPDLNVIWGLIQNGQIHQANAADLHVTEDQLRILRSPSMTIGDVQGTLRLPVTHSLTSSAPNIAPVVKSAPESKPKIQATSDKILEAAVENGNVGT